MGEPISGEGTALRCLDNMLAALVREESRLEGAVQAAHDTIATNRRILTHVAEDIRDIQAALATLRGDTHAQRQ
jgi:hypothetical protein